MTKHHFRQAVKIGRKAYPLGIHEVPSEDEKHKDFAFFRKAGYITAPGAEVSKKAFKDLPTLPKPSSEVAKHSASAAKAQQPVEPDAEIGGDEAPAKKHGKKER